MDLSLVRVGSGIFAGYLVVWVKVIASALLGFMTVGTC